MIMGHPSNDLPHTSPQDHLRSAIGGDKLGKKWTTAICMKCASLTYISETETVDEVACPRCHGQLCDSDEEEQRIGHAEPIRVSCPQCGASLHIPPALAGRHVFCITCGCRLLVTLIVHADPVPRVRTESPRRKPPASVAETGADDEMIRVTCRCGKRLKAEPVAANRTVDCPRCGLSVTFPDKSTRGRGIGSSNVNCRPKTADAKLPVTTPSQSSRRSPLPPHEAAIAARDQTIDAALLYLAHGTDPSHCQPVGLHEDDTSRFQDIAHATWLWPATAAIAATSILMIVMRILISGV